MNLKEKVIKAMIQHHEKIVDDFETILKRQKEDADIDEEATKDKEDFARQDSSDQLIKNNELQLSKAQNDLNVLKKLDSSPKESIETGALVQTDSHNVLVGVVSTPVKVDGKEFYGITTQAPIFLSMKDKKAGDTFEYGGKSFTIKSVS